MLPIKPAVFTVCQTADYLSISKPTVYRLARVGALPHCRVGAMLRFRVCDLDAYLAARTTCAWAPGERTNCPG